MKRMRLLITGGAGCLGSNLVERFLRDGHEICVIDNYATGRRESLAAAPGLSVQEGSIADPDLVVETFSRFRPTHVIHSAAAYKDPQNWAEDVATNVLGAVHVAKAALALNVERVINFQTALCYGRPRQVPIPIDHPVLPLTSYGVSKTAGEQYLLNAGLPVISLRLANVCGPRLAIGPIPTFYRRLKAGQACFCTEAVRDFLDMEDFLSLMDRVLRPDAQTGVFNVSTGEGHSILEIYRTVAGFLRIDPKDVPVTPPGADDVATVVLDPSATTAAFGWRAHVDFKETIRRQLAWYDAHGIGGVYSHLATPKSDSPQGASR